MNKKDRTIRAHRELAEKYRNPAGKEFFLVASCSLCAIHIPPDGPKCHGCPLADKDGYAGCHWFTSYHNARGYSGKIFFESRAKFHEKIIPILEKIPAARFTKKGWTYFEELDRNW